MTPSQVTPISLLFDVLQTDDFDEVLEDWAGENIFRRGAKYFSNNQVSNLVVTGGAKLLATVRGSKNYVSAFYLDENGDLAGDCTCPYDDICKHIVAVALTARKALLENNQLPFCGEFDSRLAKLATLQPETIAPASLKSLGKALAKLPKEALLDLLLNACEQDDDILQMCAMKADPEGMGVQTFLSSLKNEISEAASAPDFDDDYYDAPNYDSIGEKLRVLIMMEKPDTALNLAKEVFDTCSNAIETYDHDGQVIGGVGEVARAALAALHEIDWALPKKLRWAIDAILEDDFGYCECLNAWLQEIDDVSAWRDVAKYLSEPGTGDFASKATITRLRKLALKKSGQLDELLKLYEAEAVKNNSYLNLVDYLLGQGKEKDAEKWLHKAMKAPGSIYDSRNLRLRLIGIRQKEGNLDAVIALQTGIFVDFPDVREYEACAEAAKTGGRWEALKPLLMQYLTDGKLPWLDKAWPCENKGIAASPPKKFPLYAELIELAIYEKRPLDALEWHDLQRQSKQGYGVSEIRLAEAVKDAAPERAIAIWQEQAEKLIAQTNTQEYFEAGRYLEKILVLAEKMGEKNIWSPYLRSLREKHRRKKNFIKILDAVEQGRELNANVLR